MELLDFFHSILTGIANNYTSYSFMTDFKGIPNEWTLDLS